MNARAPRILVIDADRMLRELIEVALTGHGFSVLVAGDGASGVEMARTHLPDLIICDVRMKSMDGFAALSSLRKEPLTAAIPFILMTGDVNHSAMRQGMELGADDYLPKPFLIGQLLATVDARLKKLEVVRLRAEKELSALRTDLSLMLPHELRTPLVGILGFAEMIEDEADRLTPDELKEMGQAILCSARRLERLIENFLLFARMQLMSPDSEEAQGLQMGETTHTRELIEQLSTQRLEFAGRAQDLRLSLEDASAVISAELLKKMIEEVLDNALKFSPPGSTIGIESRTVKGWFRLSVKDQGRGMKPEHIARVGAYVQFDRKLYEQQGSGLGLAIIRRLAELHHGRLEIESSAETGTTVTIILPLAPVMVERAARS